MAKLSATDNLTWCHSQQFLLNSVDEVLDLGGRSAPEYQTVSGIHIPRLDCWIMQPEQDWVDADSGKARIEHPCFLLRVSCCSMKGILLLDLGL